MLPEGWSVDGEPSAVALIQVLTKSNEPDL
jgi:hypothetical protein